MFKRIVSKFFAWGCAACFVLALGMMQAYAAVDLIEYDDVIFVGETRFSDVACNGDPRDVTYTLRNTEPSNLSLYGIKINSLEDDDSCIATQIIQDGCVTDVSPPEGANGFIARYSTCDITVRVIPPACQDGPMFGNIHLELFIGVSSLEEGLTKEINAQLSVIGSGRDFAALDITNPPTTDPDYGHSQLYGDLGIVDVLFNDFEVHGLTYFSSAPQTDAAQSDFIAAFNTLSNVIFYDGCTFQEDIIFQSLESGYYCLYNEDTGDPVVAGENELRGTGDFVFYIAPFCGGVACNLIVSPADTPFTRFTYADGAKPENVYWVLPSIYELGGPPSTTASDYSSAYIYRDTVLPGTILAGAPGSSDGLSFDQGGLSSINTFTNDFATEGAVLINGRLWTYSPPGSAGGIYLQDTTVDAP